MFKVGVAEWPFTARYSPTALVRASYLTALAARTDSFWLADHLVSLSPRSIATPKYMGAARIVSKADAFLEPWTVLGYMAARNRLGRLRLGIGVTDAGRRNPAVTAQAAATLHLLTRKRAILVSAPANGKTTNLLVWIGPSRWHGSKKPSPPSGRCGTPCPLLVRARAAPISAAALDWDALATHSHRVLPAAGTESRGYPAYQAAVEVSKRLHRQLVQFPGGHLGCMTHPAEFAFTLIRTLTREATDHGDIPNPTPGG